MKVQLENCFYPVLVAPPSRRTKHPLHSLARSLTHSTARGFLQCGSTHWAKAKQRRGGNGTENEVMKKNRIRWI